MSTKRSSPSRRASALLLALWSLVLMSLSVFGVVEIVQASVQHSSHLELEAQARVLARSGLAVALDPDMLEDDSLLNQQPEAGQKWSVTLAGEAGRLNLNYLLLNKRRDVVARLFMEWGLKAPDAEQVVDSLYNWIIPADKAIPQGATATDYVRAGLTHLPTARIFQSLQEASWVMHMDEVAKVKPDWQDSFTLYSDGPIDPNETAADVTAAFFNVPLSLAEAFVSKRNGKDGVAGTADDVLVHDTPTLKAALGLSDRDLNTLLPMINYSDNVRRLVSKGEAGEVAVTISAITRLRVSPPEFMLWTEL